MFLPTTRSARARRGALAAALLALLLGATLAGCGNKGTTLNPVPDCDGTHLLVLSSGRNQPAGQRAIFLYDFDAGGFRAMLNFGGAGQDQHPAITADGKVIAVERTTAAAGQDVYVYERCSGTFLVRPELITSADETQPCFSGDTRELAFVRDTLGVPHIRLYDGLARKFIALPALDAIAASGVALRSPALDLNANLIACVSDSAGQRDIRLYSRSGDSLLWQVSAGFNSPNVERDPWLTPDGHYLAFASDRPGGRGLYDIYLYDLQAKSYVANTDSLNSDGNDVRPSVTPDGTVIVFQSDRASPIALGKWDLYNYNHTLDRVTQSFQESSTEDDVDPYVAWP